MIWTPGTAASNITQYAYHRLLTEGETEPPAPSAPSGRGKGKERAANVGEDDMDISDDGE